MVSAEHSQTLGLTTVANPASSGQDQGLFQCGFCKKNYARVDHLTRHVRSHTQERPYTCDICSKGYARPDLLKRHALSHETEQQGAGTKRKRQSESVHTGRVSQACKACAASKLKCEEQKPCKRCTQKNLVCISTNGDNLESSESGTHEDLPAKGPGFKAFVHTTVEDVDIPTQIPMQDIFNVGTEKPSGHVPARESESRNLPQMSFPDGSGVLELDGSFFPDFLRDVMMPPLWDEFAADPPGYLSQAFTPRGFMDYGFENNIELDDLDFGFLNAFNTKPTAVETQQREDAQNQEHPNSVAIGAEAFSRSSLAGWIPRQRDHGFSEQANFTLPKDVDSPEFRQSFDKGILSERLGLHSRDKILAMILEGCRPANVPYVVASFPTAEILDNLIQHFFVWHSSQIDSWIHLPTFRPSEKRAEVLATLAAAGASQTSITVLRKLGFALQEAVRLSIPKRFEEDNSTTRELQILQAYILQLDIGLWSGNRRKIEIAESFAQPGITMLRRARRFHRSMYPVVSPDPDDEGQVLYDKWKLWVEQESMKRHVYHAFLRDTQTSMSLNVNPVISYAEVNLPLPESQLLWHAESAERWKERCLAIGPRERLPSLVEVLRDTSLLALFQTCLDTQLSALILLHGFWALIWEFHQLDSLSKGSGNWNRLVLSSRHQELCQMLQHFRLSSSEWLEPLSPEVRMIQELVSMHLYMSLEELQLYAGKEDKEEARKVNESARQWINSHASRQAVWRAGQVLQAAKLFRTDGLRDFYAIAVYHAGLAFWSYGVVARVQQAGLPSTDDRLSRSPTSQTIWLDEEETADLQKFITLQRGTPGIRYSNKSAILGDSVGVMDIVREILRSNSGDQVLPPLVENLSQLLRDLGNAARVAPK